MESGAQRRGGGKAAGRSPAGDGRLKADDRREALLDAAAALLEAGGAGNVTMEAVAAEAGVSRPLVYKHFPNRDELLVALFRREAERFDAEVTAALARARGLEDVLRTTAESVLAAAAKRRRAVRGLLHGDSINAELRAAQRERNNRNGRWYRDLVVAELGIDREDAQTAVMVFFGGLTALAATWRSRTTAEERRRIVDTYMAMAMGGLERLAERAGAPAEGPGHRAGG